MCGAPEGADGVSADSLDYLLYPNVPVVIPDAAVYEATRASAKLGAPSIVDCVTAHRTDPDSGDQCVCEF